VNLGRLPVPEHEIERTFLWRRPRTLEAKPEARLARNDDATRWKAEALAASGNSASERFRAHRGRKRRARKEAPEGRAQRVLIKEPRVAEHRTCAQAETVDARIRCTRAAL